MCENAQTESRKFDVCNLKFTFLTNVQYEELSTSDKDVFSAKKELTFAVTGSKLWA